MADALVLAIDPGVTGAYALVGDTVLIGDLPLHQQHGRGTKAHAELDPHSFRTRPEHRLAHFCIECGAARPGQGATSTFRFGVFVPERMVLLDG